MLVHVVIRLMYISWEGNAGVCQINKHAPVLTDSSARQNGAR